MRKITTVMALWLAGFIPLFAQNIFPTQDAVWEESTFTIAGQFVRYRLLCGDTTINDTNYSKIYDIRYPFDGEGIATDTFPPAQFAGSLRVDPPRVYYVLPGQTEELLLYDFSLEAEVSIELPNTTAGNAGTYNVTNIDTVLINGQERKRLFLENVFGQTEDVWIESIGSVRYGLLDRGLGLVFDYGSSLRCMQFTTEGFTFRPDPNGPCAMVVTGCDVLSPVVDHSNYSGDIRVYPNPGEEVVKLDIPQDGAHWQAGLWSMEGRLVQQIVRLADHIDVRHLPRGTYWLKVFRNREYIYVEKLILH